MNSPILGLDIGLHRTGVALSESGLIAEPLTTIEWHLPHSHQLIAELLELIRRHGVNTIVIGMPLSEDNTLTNQAKKTEGIVQQLEAGIRKANLHVAVVTLNEFHSTQDAAVYFPDTDKDAAAAALILQDYLEQSGELW